jgi:TATA-box binding protein (TBP) (component of TFIID and TFIIIB)
MAISMNIDEQWESFLSSQYKDSSSIEEDSIDDEMIDEKHELLDDCDIPIDYTEYPNLLECDYKMGDPTPTDIYISTKTKIAYLNKMIDLKTIFWKLPVILYCIPTNGIIKKQMKFNSNTREELNFIQENLKDVNYFEENIITHIDNPDGRIKFKDTRKISIGLSKKDILTFRCKKKSAFYNCFVIILRIKIENIFKEFHIKIFNTGKLEIPGIQSEKIFQILLLEVIKILQPYMDDKLDYKINSEETVLINSNFNCGFFINRENLFDILKLKYNIQAIYDPCSYPGIQCKFYYNPNVGIQCGSQILTENKEKYKNITEVSFMIFRTGSVLIVGKCDENVLYSIYEFLKKILHTEYNNIYQHNPISHKADKQPLSKLKKTRRKSTMIEVTK